MLMLLGYLLHLRGHSAEPTSLYMLAMGCGGGPVASYLLGRISAVGLALFTLFCSQNAS